MAREELLSPDDQPEDAGLLLDEPGLRPKTLTEFVADLRAAAGTDADQAVAEWFESNSELVDRRVTEMQETATANELYRMFSSLSSSKRDEVVRDLLGFERVSKALP